MKRTFVISLLLLVASTALASNMELTSARLYKKQGEWLKSLEFYNTSIRKDPTDLDAYYERGELFHDLASDPSKKALVKQIVGDTVAHPTLVMFDRMLEDFHIALTPKGPDDAGKVKRLQKKVDEVLDNTWTLFYGVAVQSDSAYTRAIAEKKTNPDPKVYLQNSLLSLDMAIKLYPQKWNAYGLKGQVLEKMDNLKDAAVAWSGAVTQIMAADKSKQDTDEYKQGLAISREHMLVDYYNLGDYPNAARVAEEIHKADPLNVNAIQLKSESLQKMAEDTTLTADRRAELHKDAALAMEEVLKSADEVLKKDSADKDAMKDAIQLKAQTLARMASDEARPESERKKLKSDAVAALEMARKSRPDDTDILYTIGQFNLQLGDTVAAETAFSDYLKKDPNDRDVNFALGVIYMERGSKADLEKARDVFKHLTELFPEHGPSWINYGVALARLGQTTEGGEMIKKGKAIGGK
jgi:tetratricopeptide (TPR) repeat protein